jgi:predicted ArsR family transcriptional regulator
MKEAAELFKLLSVDTRIEIVELLKRGPMTVNALAEALGVTQSAVSQHLRVLRSAALLPEQGGPGALPGAAKPGLHLRVRGRPAWGRQGERVKEVSFFSSSILVIA